MAKHRLLVFTKAVQGKDAEFNKWYDEVHLKEVLEIEGFVAAQRFALSDDQMAGMDAGAPGRYLAVYEIEAESVQSAIDKLTAGAGTMNISDAIDAAQAKVFAFTAIGERRLAG